VGAIDSLLYGKVRSKKLYYVLVQYTVGAQGRAQLWVAKISYFLKVSGEGNSKEDLKLAVDTLYRKPAMVEGVWCSI
jgi:hypothetical protein